MAVPSVPETFDDIKFSPLSRAENLTTSHSGIVYDS